MEGIDVDKHPGTQRRNWTSIYPCRPQRIKQGVDLTKYLLLRSLIPSNITFQRWWGLQGRCTPALPTAKIGRLSQPGLWEKPFELSRQGYRNLTSGLFCLATWEPERISSKGGSKRRQFESGWICRLVKKNASCDFNSPEVMNSLWLCVTEALISIFICLIALKKLNGLPEVNIIVDRKQR